MKLDAETREFSVDMKQAEEIVLIEKMESCDTFWSMSYFKHKPDSNIDYDLNVNVNPLKIIYESTFITEIVKFFSTDYNRHL